MSAKERDTLSGNSAVLQQMMHIMKNKTSFTNCNRSTMSTCLSVNDKQIGCDCLGIDIKNTHTAQSTEEGAKRKNVAGCLVFEV